MKCRRCSIETRKTINGRCQGCDFILNLRPPRFGENPPVEMAECFHPDTERRVLEVSGSDWKTVGCGACGAQWLGSSFGWFDQDLEPVPLRIPKPFGGDTPLWGPGSVVDESQIDTLEEFANRNLGPVDDPLPPFFLHPPSEPRPRDLLCANCEGRATLFRHGIPMCPTCSSRMPDEVARKGIEFVDETNLSEAVAEGVEEGLGKTYRSDRHRLMIETRLRLEKTLGVAEGVAMVQPLIDELQREIQKLKGEDVPEPPDPS